MPVPPPHAPDPMSAADAPPAPAPAAAPPPSPERTTDPEDPPAEFRAAVRAVLERAAAERQPWLTELIVDVMDDAEDREDAATAAAIREGLKSPRVDRAELDAILGGVAPVREAA